jgi:hypothetical protein
VKPTNPVIEAARRAGIDVDLLDTNLALPISERWRQHEAALQLALTLQAAKRVRDAKSQRTPPAAR